NCNTYHGQINEFFSNDCASNPSIATCRPRPENYFAYSFTQPIDSFIKLHQWINSIPSGHYILFYSWSTTNYSTTPLKPELDSIFSDLGITEWQSTQPNAPFIFFVKKGYSSSYKYVKNGSDTDISIELDATIRNQW